MPGRTYASDLQVPIPIVNYAINPSFEDGDPTSYTPSVANLYAGWTRGWAAHKSAAGDTVTFSKVTGAGNCDTDYGGLSAAQIVKTGVAGGAYLTMAVPTRISRHFFNRQYTLGIRVACSAVGIVNLRHFGTGGIWRTSPTNVKGDGTYETIYMTIAPGSHAANTIAFGAEMLGAGTVKVDSAFLVDGGTPPTPLQYSCTPQTNGINIWDGFGANADPKCVKGFGSGNWFTIPFNTTTLLPFNVAEVDTDRMGLTNGRIVINTDGRYLVSWNLMSDLASVAGNWFSYCARSGGQIPFRNGTLTLPLSAAYTSGGAYMSTHGSFVEDFIAGDYLEIYAYVSAGGGTVRIHYNDTQFSVLRVGD